MDDDDYWNTSETSARAFNFDDDLLSAQEMLAIGKAGAGATGEADTDSVLGGSTIKTSLLPLSSLISPAAMQLVLLAQSGDPPDAGKRTASMPVPDSVPSTVRNLVLRRPCSLHVHRTLADKTALLDAAVALGDGDAILGVISYLLKTLQRSLVHTLLAARPLALSHHVATLRRENRLSELTDLLTMVGKSSEAAMYEYEAAVKCDDDPSSLLGRLRRLQTNHFADNAAASSFHGLILSSHIKFLEWQVCANVPELYGRSPLQCVAYCTQRHGNETSGKIMSPMTLCQQQQISVQQHSWVALHAAAAAGDWDAASSLLLRRGWLGRTALSGGVPLPLALATLREHGAPASLLADIVRNVASPEQRLEVAKQYQVHSVAIELLVRARDRRALAAYKVTLQPHSEEYFLAENSLRDTSIKWKN